MHRLFPLLTIALLGCMSEYELQVDEQAKQQDLATAMHDDAIDRSGPVVGLFPPLQLPPPGTSWFPPEQPGAIRPTLGSGQASPGNVPVTSTGSETAIVPATVPTPDRHGPSRPSRQPHYGLTKPVLAGPAQTVGSTGPVIVGREPWMFHLPGQEVGR